MHKDPTTSPYQALTDQSNVQGVCQVRMSEEDEPVNLSGWAKGNLPIDDEEEDDERLTRSLSRFGTSPVHAGVFICRNKRASTS